MTCYILPNQQIFRKYITSSILKKWLCGPDEMASQAGFGPRAVVWRPWLKHSCVTVSITCTLCLCGRYYMPRQWCRV